VKPTLGRQDKKKQIELTKGLLKVDALMLVKTQLSAECTRIVLSININEDSICRAMATVLHKNDVRSEACRIKWNQNMNCRRQEYVRAQTASIRQVTVIGLEPEVERLMQKQKQHIVAQRTARDLAWGTIRTDLNVKLFDQQVALRETMSRVDARRDFNETIRIGQSIAALHLEFQHHCTITSRAQSGRIKNLQAELQEKLHLDSAEFQCVHQNLCVSKKDRLKTRSVQLTRVRDAVYQLQCFGSRIVAEARNSDHAVWIQATISHVNTLAKELSSVRTEEVLRRRDTTIGNIIHHHQASTHTWELDIMHAAEAHETSCKGSHCASIARLQVQRTDWIKHTKILIREIRSLNQEVCVLKAIGDKTENRWHDMEMAVAKPIHEAGCHAYKLLCTQTSRLQTHTQELCMLDDKSAAAVLPINAITSNIRRLVATYDFLQGQHHEFHQRALMSKNKAVQCHLRDNANKLVRIVDKIALEKVRHIHLGKLLANYTKS